MLDVSHRRRRRYLEDLLVAEPDNDRFTAVETTAVDSDFSAGKEPADRQRLNPSLAVPLLDPVD
jgi:hypothetical protein